MRERFVSGVVIYIGAFVRGVVIYIRVFYF